MASSASVAFAWWLDRRACTVLQVYATSMAMLVTMLVSIALFGLSPTLQLGLGIATASISLVLYYGTPALLMNVRPVPVAANPAEKANLLA